MADKFRPHGPGGRIVPKPDGGVLEIDDEIVLEGSCHWVRKRAAEIHFGWQDPSFTNDSAQAREFLKKVKRP